MFSYILLISAILNLMKKVKMNIKEKVIILLFLGLILSLSVNIFFLYQNMERNKVVKVVDGDSFSLADGRRIRLLGIDAPERERCMAEEARKRLQEEVKGKIVKLTDMVNDDYGRMLANVWVDKKLVNKILVSEGLAKFVYVKSPYYEEIKQAGQEARDSQKGIYSARCRTASPNIDCLIKGNIRDGNQKVYHLPDCPNFDQVIIDESFGDQWFCTETDAQKAGFRKAEGC